MTMTTRTREQKGRNVQVFLEPTQDTRAYASWWLHQLQLRVRSHGYTWHKPAISETSLGEVSFQWEHVKAHRSLSLYVDANQSVTYIRYWDTHLEHVLPASAEGECAWFDHALLLWHWLFSSPSP